MGGGSTSSTNSSSSQVNMIPQWVQNAGEQNYALAQNIAERPLQQYEGQMVAGVAPQQQQAWNLAASSGNVGTDQFNGATAGALGALGQTPMSIDPSQLSKTDLSPYMNPYTQNVINATLPIMQQNLALSQNQNQNAASSAGAFGGSRQGVQQGVTQAQGALGMGQMAQQLNQANFTQAQAAAGSDVAAQNLAKYQNQTAEQAKINSDIAASNSLATTGTDMGRQNAANYAMLTSAGAAEQQQQQNEINANIAKFQQAWNYPASGLNLMESSLSTTPYNTASAGTQNSNTQSQDTPNFASLALGGLQSLGSMFAPGTSDRKLKTDITKVDDHPSGVPIYSYRYKGDPKTYPKVMGPMAEDVAKVAPAAVKPMGVKGRLAVDMHTLNAFTPPPSPGAARGIQNMGGSGPMTPPSSLGAGRGVMALGAFAPRTSATAMPRAGARGMHGALANTKRSPRVMGMLGRG